MDLKRIRQQLDISREALARELDVNPRTIRRWENKEAELPKVAVMAIKLLAQEMGIRLS